MTFAHALTVLAEIVIVLMLVGSSSFLILVGLRAARLEWRRRRVDREYRKLAAIVEAEGERTLLDAIASYRRQG